MINAKLELHEDLDSFFILVILESNTTMTFMIYESSLLLLLCFCSEVAYYQRFEFFFDLHVDLHLVPLEDHLKIFLGSK